MASFSTEGNVDLRDIAFEIRVEITNIVDLVKAIRVGQSLLPYAEDGVVRRQFGELPKFHPL